MCVLEELKSKTKILSDVSLHSLTDKNQSGYSSLLDRLIPKEKKIGINHHSLEVPITLESTNFCLLIPCTNNILFWLPMQVSQKENGPSTHKQFLFSDQNFHRKGLLIYQAINFNQIPSPGLTECHNVYMYVNYQSINF